MSPPIRLTLVLSASVLSACGGGGGGAGDGGGGGRDGGGRKRALNVYVAASLRNAMEELIATYEVVESIEINPNFGSSGTLSQQVEQGGQADVFFSAGEEEMDRLERKGLLEPGTRRTLLSNQLVVIVPVGGRRLRDPRELAGDWLELLSVANTDSVPAGRYAKQWLEKIGLWDVLEDRILRGSNVRGALAAVEIQSAEAGIVYRTDAAISDRVEIVLTVPIELGPKISYPVAVLAGRKRKAVSRGFVDFLAGPQAREVFRRYGFLVGDGR